MSLCVDCIKVFLSLITVTIVSSSDCLQRFNEFQLHISKKYENL